MGREGKRERVMKLWKGWGGKDKRGGSDGENGWEEGVTGRMDGRRE